MPIDIRQEAAKYYDAGRVPFEDIGFYRKQIPHPLAHILELGCGTGRVLLPLVGHCGYIHGLDCSEAMLEICQAKLAQADVAAEHARVELADITDFNLSQQFDLIIAPFRVLQNLATDVEVEGLFRAIRRHLAPGGTAILNVFHPNRDRNQLLVDAIQPMKYEYEIPLETGSLRRYCQVRRVTAIPLVQYIDLIYRYYLQGQLIEESIMSIAMRCYYPAEFLALIEQQGFNVIGKWGGYAGEVYGEGGELVIAFMEGE